MQNRKGKVMTRAIVDEQRLSKKEMIQESSGR